VRDSGGRWVACCVGAVGIGLVTLSALSSGQRMAIAGYVLGAIYLAVAAVGWRARATRPSRWAWTACLLTVVGFVVGVVAVTLLGGILDMDLWSTTSLSRAEAFTASLSFWAFCLSPAVAGAIFGVRAARGGSRSGLAAALVNGLIAAVVVALAIADLAALGV